MINFNIFIVTEIKYIESTPSTNILAKEQDEEGVIYVAHSQTQGRGQRGTTWESEPYKNLTFSFVIKPGNLTLYDQFYISKYVSMAVIDTLRHYKLDVTIKWPNDIYVGNNKICGILIENDVSGSARIMRSVVGIGINVNQINFTSNIPNPISMANVLGKEIDIKEIMVKFSEFHDKWYSLLKRREFEIIDVEYFNSLFRLNTIHKFKDKEGLLEGKITNVLPTGELIIEKKNGKRSLYLFKEVEYIL